MAKSGKKKVTDAERKRRRVQGENSGSDKPGAAADGKKTPYSRHNIKGHTSGKGAEAPIQSGGQGRSKQDP